MQHHIVTVKAIIEGTDIHIVKVGSIGEYFNPNYVKDTLTKHFKNEEPNKSVALIIDKVEAVSPEEYIKRNTELVALNLD